MESQCIRVKLRPGKTEQFLTWANTLTGRLNEVKEALSSEGMLAELMLLERASDGDYIVLYTKAENLAEANDAFEKSGLKLDQEAKKVMSETWDFASVRQVERLLEYF
jgi:hypothetical protein